MFGLLLLFELFEVVLPQLGNFGNDDHAAVALVGVALEVVLVIFLSGVKRPQRLELGDQRAAIIAAGAHLGHHLLGGLFLLGRVVIDGRAILGADIGALAVEGSGVVNGKKHFQDVLVGDN